VSGTKSAKTAPAQRNRPFGDAVSYCSYFYQDAFALLTVRSSVLQYRFDPHSRDADDDLKRTLALGSYKLVSQWDFSSRAMDVTAAACLNAVQSPLVFCATSDKFLHILDASTGTVARTLPLPHARPAHCIALPQPSVHVGISPDAYNLFLTAATDNCICLWDLRAPSLAARYPSHNSREAVGCALSPCLRYIALGSEDRYARVLDLGSGRELAKLGGPGNQGHRDCVTAVAYHPTLPLLATAGFDGSVRFYADPHM